MARALPLHAAGPVFGVPCSAGRLRPSGSSDDDGDGSAMLSSSFLFSPLLSSFIFLSLLFSPLLSLLFYLAGQAMQTASQHPGGKVGEASKGRRLCFFFEASNPSEWSCVPVAHLQAQRHCATHTVAGGTLAPKGPQPQPMRGMLRAVSPTPHARDATPGRAAMPHLELIASSSC